MTAKADKCIFCGIAGPLTKEHVFPRWSHQYLGPRQTGRVISRVGTLYYDRDETRDARLPGQLRDWQVKCVCGGTHMTCNSGWMKEIEDKAKPILVPLIEGKRSLLSLDDQITIATWAVLKSIVSEYHLTSKVSTHWAQRRLMKHRKQPPANGWRVWIGHFARKHWKPEWISNSFFVASKAIQSRRGLREPTYFNASSTTQVIGKLFIQVIHLPGPLALGNDTREWRVPPPTCGVLTKIWPRPHMILSWPQPALSDLDADTIASAMQKFLSVVSKRPIYH
jgi:hypothetical protein